MIDDSKTLILDASVLAKWLLNEEGDREGLEQLEKDLLSGKIQLMAPFLLFWELGNLFGRLLPVNQALEKMNILDLLKIRKVDLSLELNQLAFKLMKLHSSISFYDASYHALAISQKATLVTCDEKYYRHAKKQGYISLLKSYSSKNT